jgi:hypothetical protein
MNSRLAAGFVLAVAIGVAVFQLKASPQAEKDYDINTALMKATFKIEGRTVQGQPTFGTAFIMGRPYSHPPADQPRKIRFVLITAAHVLNEMQGDQAILHLRRNVNADNWVRVPFPIAIRTNGQAIWKKHPDADVAVMYIALPNDAPFEHFSTDMLADDKMMENYEIHPGDELKCLGYPFGLESNNAGFPVLRSGKIASYPLLPTALTRTFLFDFRVFQGNSGGPVYFEERNRTYQGNLNVGNHIQFIVGLISEEKGLNLPYSQLQLGLAVVVHASLIREAINSLPPADSLPD